MPWQQISVTTEERLASDLSELFSQLGALSVTYMDAEDQPIYEPDVGEIKIWHNTQVIALYEADVDIAAIKSAVQRRFAAETLSAWHIEDVEDQAWERAWMQYYQPMKFGGTLWVCPTGQEYQEPGTVCLTMDPGLAFGTGTHPTTALCLEWLAEHELTDKTVIDYGCGSGILAVAAILLGAKHAYALDIDPQALTASADNALKNNVQNQITCVSPGQLNDITADVVIANILAKPLIELSETILSLLKPGGDLVLSGILNEQTDKVKAAYCEVIHFNPVTSQEDWIRLDGVKQSHHVHPLP